VAEHTSEQLAEFSKNAGRPPKLDGKARRRLRALLAAGKTQGSTPPNSASTPTIGRADATMRTRP
jgi:hypothetical protein